MKFQSIDLKLAIVNQLINHVQVDSFYTEIRGLFKEEVEEVEEKAEKQKIKDKTEQENLKASVIEAKVNVVKNTKDETWSANMPGSVMGPKDTSNIETEEDLQLDLENDW